MTSHFNYTEDDAIEDKILEDREEANAVPPCAEIPVACNCGIAPSVMGTRAPRKWRVRCFEPDCRASGPERVSIEDAITDWNTGERVFICAICRQPDEGLEHRHPSE